MRILGIETSGDWGGVALVENDRLLREVFREIKSAHTQHLIPMVREVLEVTGLEVTDLGGVAVSLGPGSFTGLRAGLGAGKGLSYSLGLRIVGIPTLEVQATEGSVGGWVLSLADARRGEVFSALYERMGPRLVERWPARLDTVRTLVPRVLESVTAREGVLEVLGDIRCPLEAVVAALAAAGVDIGGSARVRPRPSRVAQLGVWRLLEGAGDEVMTLEPLYVRPSDAETKQRP